MATGVTAFQSTVYRASVGPFEIRLAKSFCAEVSTRQAGPALAGLLDEAVSAATVSAVAKVLDESVGAWHRRKLCDHYRYLILDGVSVRLRLVGKVQRRVALCAYGISEKGKRELVDFLVLKNGSEESWKSLLLDLWNRGLHGEQVALIVTDGHAGLVKALGAVWPRPLHQRCWVHKLRNLQSRLKAAQRPCLEEAKRFRCQPDGDHVPSGSIELLRHRQTEDTEGGAFFPRLVGELADSVAIKRSTIDFSASKLNDQTSESELVPAS